ARFPDAGIQPRSQHARLEIGRRPHLAGGGRTEGADRTAARAGAEYRVGEAATAATARQRYGRQRRQRKDSTMRGNLFIVSAPSGAGKSSLVNAVLAVEPQIALSISFTSR